MENEPKKCSHKEHKEINAIEYCQDCKLYLCNKCSIFHNGFENHHHYNITKDSNDIFIDICQELNHTNKLEYYCKEHNKLVCLNCIAKLKGKGNGQHKDCDICFIEDIKDEKRNKLKENVKFLENLLIDNSIKELKELFEKISAKKEEIKLNIQKIFTKLRSILNEREDELLLEVDKYYNDLFCNENIIKQSEDLPNKIKKALEKVKLIENSWNDNIKLINILNDCINIEDYIKNIYLINDNIKKCNSKKDIKIEFYFEDKFIDNFKENIKGFGKLNNFNLDSLILKNQNEINKFYNLVNNKIKINNMKLLYRYSKDGLELATIKDKINNKSNLIFLYYTGNQRIFGAYIKTKLEDIQEGKYFKDENAFVFSLNNNKIYQILVPKYSIQFYSGHPLLIGNVGNNTGFFHNGKTIYDKGLTNTPKIYDFQRNYELTEKLNELTEFEIHEININ